MLYYATRISENIAVREPQGYLICQNVPIARTGKQDYLAEELGLDDRDGEDIVQVNRPEEEVFDKATIASFEGMPVTDDHPDGDEGVTAENAQYLTVGHVQNVHRGTGAEKNMLIADLFITDPRVIDEVKSGRKREISCGYTYELDQEGRQFYQRAIRGNHIAIVDKGRAGHRVAIKDSKNWKERKKTMSKKSTRNDILSRMFAAFARDAEPEEIAEAADEIQEIAAEGAKPEIKDEDTPQVPPQFLQNQQPATDADKKMQMMQDEIDELKQQLADCIAGKKSEGDEDETDPLAKLEDDLDDVEEQLEEGTDDEEELAGIIEEEDEDEEEKLESHYVDPDELNEEDEDVDEVIAANQAATAGKQAVDAARAAIRACRPFINSLPPAQQRRAADALVRNLRKASGMDGKAKKNAYLTIKKAKAKDSAKRSEKALGKKIMSKRNANMKK